MDMGVGLTVVSLAGVKRNAAGVRILYVSVTLALKGYNNAVIYYVQYPVRKPPYDE